MRPPAGTRVAQTGWRCVSVWVVDTVAHTIYGTLSVLWRSRHGAVETWGYAISRRAWFRGWRAIADQSPLIARLRSMAPRNLPARAGCLIPSPSLSLRYRASPVRSSSLPGRKSSPADCSPNAVGSAFFIRERFLASTRNSLGARGFGLCTMIRKGRQIGRFKAQESDSPRPGGPTVHARTLSRPNTRNRRHCA